MADRDQTTQNNHDGTTRLIVSKAISARILIANGTIANETKDFVLSDAIDIQVAPTSCVIIKNAKAIISVILIMTTCTCR